MMMLQPNSNSGHDETVSLALAPLSLLHWIDNRPGPEHRHDNFDQDLTIIPGRPRTFQPYKCDFGAYK